MLIKLLWFVFTVNLFVICLGHGIPSPAVISACSEPDVRAAAASQVAWTTDGAAIDQHLENEVSNGPSEQQICSTVPISALHLYASRWCGWDWQRCNSRRFSNVEVPFSNAAYSSLCAPQRSSWYSSPGGPPALEIWKVQEIEGCQCQVPVQSRYLMGVIWGPLHPPRPHIGALCPFSVARVPKGYT